MYSPPEQWPVCGLNRPLSFNEKRNPVGSKDFMSSVKTSESLSTVRAVTFFVRKTANVLHAQPASSSHLTCRTGSFHFECNKEIVS